MQTSMGLLWARRNWLQISSLLIAATCVLYITRIPVLRHSDMEALQKASGLAARDNLSSPPFESSRPDLYLSERVLGSALGAVAARPPATATGVGSTSQGKIPDRKIVRTSVLELTVTAPEVAAEKIRLFAESIGGYLETAQISGQETPSATVTIRVPAARLEQVKAELRKLAVHIDGEKTDARDVTKEYVDMQARMRNLRAEEAQYLQIMKSATRVQDMLDVSEKLSGVRGEIEQQQAEFEALSKQSEMAAITVSLRVQPKPEAFGLNWQPLRRLKIAAHDALDGIADYASTITAVILYLPVLLLWGGTIVSGIAVGRRLVRWVAREYFPKTVVEAKAS
jgi:hypothetical protein